MDIYHYHPVTKKFLSVGQADEDPLDKGKFLIPAHATIEQPMVEHNKVSVFSNGVWLCVDPLIDEEEKKQRQRDEIVSQIRDLDNQLKVDDLIECLIAAKVIKESDLSESMQEIRKKKKDLYQPIFLFPI